MPSNACILGTFVFFMTASGCLTIAALLTKDWIHQTYTLHGLVYPNTPVAGTNTTVHQYQGIAHGTAESPCIVWIVNNTGDGTEDCPFLDPSLIKSDAQRSVYGLMVSGIVFCFLSMITGLITCRKPSALQPTKSFMYLTLVCLVAACIVFPVMFKDPPINGSAFDYPSTWAIGFSYAIAVVGAALVFGGQIVISCYQDDEIEV
ncbi:hypothetical protein CAOG_05597 [Capsaspora owczarzaki ATCC 30864]|uniref:Uncharacterized protein n=1 Tax=Capsaspora owczarzaki (strain ATCC 30864) TaxID=595528 RepID=A0A0D2WTT2_CAPO3|nr:hypothetical protein CAOG_05597 [Capsaspora owczarzaki ATCC 30864]KJE95108.1 hypothetical protein CAOG_005597 [Capsaspora owczarzaki ATCC 30864]|eukprot:XP_004346270.2 hypothetical protein CAOG_05597 [Capsaspora owczarzaki ATCC 30864]